jgi:Flp pilus assembly protein TadG
MLEMDSRGGRARTQPLAREATGSVRGSGRRRPGWRDEGGAVEMTALLIIFPLLFFFFLFAVQATIAARANQILKSAAQEAARVARLEDKTEADAQERADKLLDTLDPEVFSVAPTVEVDYLGNNDRVRVVVTGTVQSIVPGFGPSLTQVSEGPVERFRGADE